VIQVYQHKEEARPPAQTLAFKPQPSVVLFCLLAKEVRTKQGECLVCSALGVKELIGGPWHRLRPLPATPLVMLRSYVIKVPSPLPAAPLAVHRWYLIVVLWLFPR
jgi:hypothetical protein